MQFNRLKHVSCCCWCLCNPVDSSFKSRYDATAFQNIWVNNKILFIFCNCYNIIAVSFFYLFNINLPVINFSASTYLLIYPRQVLSLAALFTSTRSLLKPGLTRQASASSGDAKPAMPTTSATIATDACWRGINRIAYWNLSVALLPTVAAAGRGGAESAISRMQVGRRRGWRGVVVDGGC